MSLLRDFAEVDGVDECGTEGGMESIFRVVLQSRVNVFGRVGVVKL